jgi:hypothetical protein
MSQQTNLNVSPYFDDFNSNNDYHKVLFKPGYPVQARELTTLQSILQNQIEKFGQHFFKEGAKVIPGNISYNAIYYAVELSNTYIGIPVDAYVGQLIGTKITGLTSGVTAVVEKILLSRDSERGNTTLYINYLSSNTQNNSTQEFLDGELLSSGNEITSGLLGNITITAGTPFASTISNNASSVGASFSIANGVYFIRGQFVNVKSETLILDQYSNKPNCRVGLFINEQIINSDIDESLNDNSQGFNNYAAPGADRLKISVSLFKKNLEDFDDGNFIELSTIKDGIIRSQKIIPGKEPNLIIEEVAKRTHSQSGDYIIDPFNISVKESLNDGIGNGGIFNSDQFTYGGSVPSEDLSIYQISPGKAVIKGYEVEPKSLSFLDVPKPRTIKTLLDQAINYNTGATIKLNRVYGVPTIGIGNTYVLSLRDSRVGSISTVAPGKEIGVARVYDFRLESGSYNNANKDLNEWHISLYDIQTITEITLNQPITLSVPTFVKGKYSGATGFLKDSVTAGIAITIYDKFGDFIPNESFLFDEIEDNRVAISVTSYGISDIKAISGFVGSASTFTADVIQSELINIGIASISASSSGISTVTISNSQFPGKTIKPSNLIKYSNFSSNDPVIAKVVSVGTSQITISGVSTVFGVTQGNLPNSNLNVTDLKLLSTILESSSDNTLYASFPKINIESVDISNASLSIRKIFTVNIDNNQLSETIFAGVNETFLPFDVERYLLIRSDGITETLTSDKFSITSTNSLSELQIYNLGSNNVGATLITTIKKIKPKEKIKLKNRVNFITVEKSKFESSGIGLTTLNDGLTYGNYPYGTRVQDKNISLNTPDIIEIHAIYESSNTNSADAPTILLSSISGPTTKTSDLIIGEQFVGENSGTIAIIAERKSDSQISYITKNQNNFKEGETVSFKESGIKATITTLNTTSFNISARFSYENGQNGSFYDYGKINRKSEFSEPTKKLKIYFSDGYYQSTDNGDITTSQSYNSFNYSKEIQTINGIRNTDIIDIRPRVSNYSVLENSRSPFEFHGRTFNSTGNSSTYILASNESIITTFSFYLGRIDRIYLTKDGNFQIKYGTPSEKPEKSVSVDDALEIGSITLPPYLYTSGSISIEFLEHKRFRMVDIKQLENRIKNLEYYTALSLLETNTANLFISDSNGLNAFKSGFFVDNFSSLITQENGIEYKNSIDLTNKELRPKHYTTSIDLIFGPVTNVDPNQDLAFSVIEGNNVRKTTDIITLDYAEVEWLKQSFATRPESVTPFLISFWQGTLELTPASDTWVDVVRIEAKTIDTEGNYAQTIAEAVGSRNLDPQTGFIPIVWNSWVDNYTGQEVINTTKTNTTTTGNITWIGGPAHGGVGRGTDIFGTEETTTIQDNFREVIQTGQSTRSGIRTIISEQFDKTSVGDRVVSRDLISSMRSRNIQFVLKKVKPLTQLYAFFDGIDVTKYCVPKLIEISMISGVFEVGEPVLGSVRPTGLDQWFSKTAIGGIIFRVAQSNHKEGPYNSAISSYPFNPYTGQILQNNYSSTSNILNIDIFSLSNQPEGLFSGYLETDMILVGTISGAQATITNLRLVSDLSAGLIGSFFIPNPNFMGHPRFQTGNKVLTFVNNKNNDQNSATTIAEEGFSSNGTLETVQENIISVRNARVQNKQEFEERALSKTTGTQLVSSNLVNKSNRNVLIGWYDPLAQSFRVEDSTGIFITRCDIFFRTKDDMDIPVTLQIRTMQGNSPSQKILPFSEITLDPSQVRTSGDSSVATSFIFKSPVYLEGNTEYSICVASNSTKYSVYISRVGETDLLTQSYISNQPYLGSLFKSQNGSTWEPSGWEDLKFVIYRADFLSNGTVEFYNPELSKGNSQIPTLMPDSLILNSRKIRVGLGTTVQDSGLKLGNTVLQLGTNATGNYVASAGIATGTLSITNSGIGYTPSSGSFQFDNVNLTTITGYGKNATANITISNGVAIAATISSTGTGYQLGDVVGITTIGSFSIGRNARFSLVSIANTNQLILDNVQGDFIVSGVGNTVQYTNSSGITTTLNSSVGGNVQISDISIDNDGLHILVNHKNHGMYHDENYVTLSNIEPDIKPTKLTSAYTSDSISAILIENISNFTTFENIGIGTTNLGYVLIGDEIISYTSTSASSINGTIVRGSNPKNYPVGTPVYKYELGGVSLRRINKTHYLNDAIIPSPITFDSYNIKIDMSANGSNRAEGAGYPKLYLNQTKSSGGFNINASQNIPYEIITPNVHNLTVQGTNLTAEIRTISGSSINGNEIPFINKGFEPISLNKPNYLDSTRLICSKINETNKLSTLPGNKSLNMRISMSTVNSKVTPVIDTQRISTILTSNRVNDAIQNYTTDSRVNNIQTDPTAFQYLSKEIVLENSASSLKIILNAHINIYSEIRALYAISESQNFVPIYTLFPGYKNIDKNKQSINFEDNSGFSDTFVIKTNSLGFSSSDIEYKEHTFTVNQLPAFRSYRIKIILTSTNQVYVPRIKDLRVIALA